MFGSHPQDDHDLLQAQHIRNDSHLMNQLLEGDPTFAQAVLWDNLDVFQNSLRQQHQQSIRVKDHNNWRQDSHRHESDCNSEIVKEAEKYSLWSEAAHKYVAYARLSSSSNELGDKSKKGSVGSEVTSSRIIS